MPHTPPRILIVDDHDGLRTLIGRVLRLDGDDYVTDEARNGRVALDLLATTTYDAITLDLMMPEVDGYAVLAEVERTRPELLSRVIVMTACDKHATDRVNSSCIVVPKPFNATELLGAVRQIIAQTPPARAALSH